MEARARIPATLPRDHPTKAFWQDPPDADVADLQSTAALPAAVDVVIVGSGITGASIAWHLLGGDSDSDSDSTAPPSAPSLLMLEARQAASGATGRNGGHTKAASYWAFPAHATAHGTAAAVQIAQLELAGIRAVHALAAAAADDDGDEPIACDAHPCDTVDIVYDPAKWALAQTAIAALQAALPPGDPAAAYRLYGRDEALAAFPCRDDDDDDDGPDGPRHVCGAVAYEAGSISAYRFTVGMLKRGLARGLQLHTHTPVTRLERRKDNDDDGHGGWTVHTPRGAVVARHVVLATNAYAAFLVPALQGVVVPLRGQIAMHRAARTPAGGPLPHTYSFVYAAGYDYMVTRPGSGDMVLGGGLAYAGDADGEYGTTDDTTVNPAVSAYLRAAPGRYFRGREGEGEGVVAAADADADADVDADADSSDGVREWTGIMGYTPDGLPLVGALPDSAAGLWLCCAFQGHGMVFSWPCGRAVAAMVRGRDGPALRQWFPDCFRVTAERLQKPFRGRQHGAVKRE